MRISTYYLAGTLAFILMAAGCNGTITQPQQNVGTMSANFGDGTEFLAQSGTIYSAQSGYYVVTAQDNVPSDINNGDEMTLTIRIESAVPYTVTAPPDNVPEVSYVDYEKNEQYNGNSDKGECSITVTQTSPTLEGTFQALVVGSAGDTIVLSNGSFNANPQ